MRDGCGAIGPLDFMRSLEPNSLETLATLFRTGKAGIEGLVRGSVETVDDLDRHLNAVRHVFPDAIEIARELDRSPMGGRRGALFGVPIALKDNIDVEGSTTTSGCRALAKAMPRADAALVRRLKDAGAILLAKTNLSEFSFEIRSRSSLGGDVRNPFAPEVTAGGSSGGAAVAVAAGFVAAAVGTDTGGSIRTPAAYNGLVGFRPSVGVIDAAGVAPLAPSTDTVGVLARSVADASLLFGVLADEGVAFNTTDRLAHWAPTSTRIGVVRRLFGDDPNIRAAMEAALEKLREAGVEVVDPVDIPDDLVPIGREHVVDWEFGPAFNAYLAANFRSGAPASLDAILESGDYLPEHEGALRRRAAVRDRGGEVYQAIIAFHRRLRSGLEDRFSAQGLTALLYPTSAVVPNSLDNPRGGWAPELAACSGWPAISLPIARARNGVPIGLELLGRGGRDDELLRLATLAEAIVAVRLRPDLEALRASP